MILYIKKNFFFNVYKNFLRNSDFSLFYGTYVFALFLRKKFSFKNFEKNILTILGHYCLSIQFYNEQFLTENCITVSVKI